MERRDRTETVRQLETWFRDESSQQRQDSDARLRQEARDRAEAIRKLEERLKGQMQAEVLEERLTTLERQLETRLGESVRSIEGRLRESAGRLETLRAEVDGVLSRHAAELARTQGGSQSWQLQFDELSTRFESRMQELEAALQASSRQGLEWSQYAQSMEGALKGLLRPVHDVLEFANTSPMNSPGLQRSREAGFDLGAQSSWQSPAMSRQSPAPPRQLRYEDQGLGTGRCGGLSPRQGGGGRGGGLGGGDLGVGPDGSPQGGGLGGLGGTGSGLGGLGGCLGGSPQGCGASPLLPGSALGRGCGASPMLPGSALGRGGCCGGGGTGPPREPLAWPTGRYMS